MPDRLSKVELNFDDDGRITTTGLPTCNPAKIRYATIQLALQECRRARVGRGDATVVIPVGQGGVTEHATVNVFNGTRRNGSPTVLFHARADFGYTRPHGRHRQRLDRRPGLRQGAQHPDPADPTECRREGSGRHRAQDLEVRGERYSYISARCPRSRPDPERPRPVRAERRRPDPDRGCGTDLLRAGVGPGAARYSTGAARPSSAAATSAFAASIPMYGIRAKVAIEGSRSRRSLRPARRRSTMMDATPPMSASAVPSGRSSPCGEVRRPSSSRAADPVRGRVVAVERLVSGADHLDERHASKLGLGREPGEEGVEGGHHRRRPPRLRAVGALDPRVKLLDRLVVGCEEAVVLVAELLVERLPGDTGDADHVGDRSLRVAPLGDRARERVENPLALILDHERARQPVPP